MNQKKKKILVGIDGSDQSLNAVRYLADIELSSKPEVVLFHVMRTIDQAFWDIGSSPIPHGKMAEITAWETGRKKMAQEFMNAAADILITSGFPKDAVKITIHSSQKGIARDIAKESLNNYDAVVVGRKGFSKLKNMVLGSVANKLVEKLSHVPVWVIGGNPEREKVLIAMDASQGAMKAADYVGAVMDISRIEVMLFHAIRAINTTQHPVPGSVIGEYEKALVKSKNTEMKYIFDAAKERLVITNMNAANITTKFSLGVSSRAGAVMAEAKIGKFGTIVMGRRGLARVQTFIMGRVSNKVLQLAKDRAVWIVS